MLHCQVPIIIGSHCTPFKNDDAIPPAEQFSWTESIVFIFQAQQSTNTCPMRFLKHSEAPSIHEDRGKKKTCLLGCAWCRLS